MTSPSCDSDLTLTATAHSTMRAKTIFQNQFGWVRSASASGTRAISIPA